MLTDMDEQRLIEIETKLAFQEDAVRQLSDALAGQQQRVADLEVLCRQLAARLARMGDGADKGAAVDEVPPHY